MTATITLRKFIRKYKLTMASKWDDKLRWFDDPKDRGRYRYLLCLKHGDEKLVIAWRQGKQEKPKLADLLDNLASVCSSVEGSRGFEDWAGDLGYETDSRKAYRIWKWSEKLAIRLKAMLGQDGYEELIYGTERL